MSQFGFNTINCVCAFDLDWKGLTSLSHYKVDPFLLHSQSYVTGSWNRCLMCLCRISKVVSHPHRTADLLLLITPTGLPDSLSTLQSTSPLIYENVVSSNEICPSWQFGPQSLPRQYDPLEFSQLMIVLGCMSYGSDTWQKWVLNEDKALPLLKAAWDAGIQTWDTANVYSNVSTLLFLER